MKNYVLLICFMMTAGMVSAQMKVVSSGATKIGNTSTDPVAGSQLHVDGGNLYLSNGNFGLGSNATTPGGIFDISHNNGPTDLLMRMWNNGTGGSKMRFVGSNTAVSQVQMTTSGEWLSAITATGANGIEFKVRKLSDANTEAGLNSSTRLTIDRDGQVGIGTTTPSFDLHVQGTAAKPGGGMWDDAASDKRLKKNINDFNEGLETILKLRPVKYQFNDRLKSYDDGKEYIGFIAQEVQKVAPFMVKDLAYNEWEVHGKDKSDFSMNKKNEQEFLTVNSTAVTFMLINAVKEQNDRIENLESQITDLREMVNSIGSNDVEANAGDVKLVESNVTILGQNTPNPYSDNTSINYSIPTDFGVAKMNFYNMAGQLLKSYNITSNEGIVKINSSELPSGTFKYTLIVDDKMMDTKSMVVSK